MTRSNLPRLLVALAIVLLSVDSAFAQQPPAAPAAPGAAPGGGPGGGRGRGGRGGPGMALTSTAWPDGGEIPQKHAGRGGLSPALSWTSVPAGTAEFVLIMQDLEPVVPALSVSGDILHWLVAKIPAATTSLPEGAGAAQSTLLPAGARQIQPYNGPGAPAAGPRHHYILTLYALNAALELPAELAGGAGRAAVLAAMEGKVLGRAIFTGRYMQPPPAAAPAPAAPAAAP